MSSVASLQRAHSAALRLIAYRPRTRKELATRLGRRFAADVVDSVVSLLTAEGFLDDARFAGEWRASRESHSPRSSWAVRRELEARGVERSVASEAVRDMDDVENAYAAGAKAARRLAGLDLTVFRRRLWGYLKRRGFSDSLTRRTIERLIEEAEEG